MSATIDPEFFCLVHTAATNYSAVMNGRRNTQGVKLLTLNEDDKLVVIVRVISEQQEDEGKQDNPKAG